MVERGVVELAEREHEMTEETERALLRGIPLPTRTPRAGSSDAARAVVARMLDRHPTFIASQITTGRHEFSGTDVVNDTLRVMVDEGVLGKIRLRINGPGGGGRPVYYERGWGGLLSLYWKLHGVINEEESQHLHAEDAEFYAQNERLRARGILLEGRALRNLMLGMAERATLSAGLDDDLEQLAEVIAVIENKLAAIGEQKLAARREAAAEGMK